MERIHHLLFFANSPKIIKTENGDDEGSLSRDKQNAVSVSKLQVLTVDIQGVSQIGSSYFIFLSRSLIKIRQVRS